MLYGDYNHSLDEKGRLIIPAKMRAELGSSFIITKGLDGCLFAYSNEAWKAFSEQLEAIPTAKKEFRMLKRMFYMNVVEVSFDKQGRILIPQKLRDEANIFKEVLIIGMGTKLEIWGAEAWNGEHEPEAIDMDDIAERLDDYGIKF